MKTLFLKLKHWQLFMLFFVVPMIIYVITIVRFVATMMNFNNARDFDPAVFSGLFGGVALMVFISLGTMSLWNWTIGTKLIEHIPQELKLKNKFFKFTVIFPFVYMFILMLLMTQLFQTIDFQSHQPPNFNPLILLLIIPCHFFMIFCSFYNIYFTSKTIKTALLKREVTFGDYVGDFFLILFFFIGVWIIQPKVNQLIESEDEI